MMDMKAILTSLLLACTAMAVGQTLPTDSVAGEVQHIRELTVSGRRPANSVLASKPIQQMDRDELEHLGLQTLADAVKHFAGASVRDYGGIGGMKTVSVRNLGAHHTAVSYDGITVSNTQAGQIDIGRYSLDNVQTLSLSLGDAQNQLQTARHYASAGVLSIETERPHFADGQNQRLFLRLRGGSFGLIAPSLRYWQRLGQRTSLAVNGGYMRADGIYPFTLVNGKNKTRERRINSDVYSWQGEANLFHHFADSSQLALKAYWFYSERGLPGSVILYNNRSRERLWDEDFFAQASYAKRFSSQWRMQARLKYSHTWNRYEDTDVKYQGGKQTDVDRQDEFYASGTVGWTPLAALTLSLAEDIAYNTLRNNVVTGSDLQPAQPRRLTSLTALAIRYKPTSRLDISADLVATYATERVNTDHRPADRHRWSPAVAFSYRLLGSEALYLRAMLKNTFRLPTFNDLYYRRMGNTGLRPERASEYNVGITWSGRPFRHIKYLSLTLDAYHNDVTDKIVAFPTTYVWRMANFGKVKINGIDATIAMEAPLWGDRMSIAATAAYTWQRAVDKLERSSSYGKQLPYTPEQSGSASLTLRNPYVNIGYSLTAQGRRWSSTQNTSEYELDGYAEHTLTLSRQFAIGRHRLLDIRASVYNLTARRYEIIKYYPMPERSWSLTGTLHL
ncbi:MAG: TonB-dependent receptor [Prevotella sp.]|nr:TonB-dependent receptor [Prevotella sp.]